MRANLEERVVEIANHIVETGDTVRQAAVVFNVSKSTVHTVVTNIIDNKNL